MKKFFKIGCLGFIVLIVIIVIVAIVSSGGDDKETTATTTDASPGSKAESTPVKKAEKVLKKMGEELQVGDVVFKVNKISTTKKITDGEYLSYSPDSDGSVFLVVNVTIKNAGNELITTDSSFFELRQGERKYTPSTLITTSKEFFLYEGINPGLSQTGSVAFEIPENEKDFILNVQTGFFGTEQGQIQLQ